MRLRMSQPDSKRDSTDIRNRVQCSCQGGRVAEIRAATRQGHALAVPGSFRVIIVQPLDDSFDRANFFESVEVFHEFGLVAVVE
jgi:hypothetical protein